MRFCTVSLALGFASAAHASSICEMAAIQADDGASGDDFGAAVAVDGTVAVIGAPEDDDGGSSSGAAYVFRFDGSGWSQEQKLTAGDAASFDDFGFAVAIDGDTIVVGAPRDDTAAGDDAGSAYVFRFDGMDWNEADRLFADDAAADDRFGYSVAISGDTILVGAINEDGGVSNSGAGYVFTSGGTIWSQQDKLSAAMPQGTNPHLGHSAALDGDVAVLGAWQDAPPGQFSVGAAHVFRRSGTTWTEEDDLTASDAADFRWFGQSVGISGSTIVVGAYGDQADGLSESGGVYVFDHDGASWSETDNLNASLPAADDRYGWSVSIVGDRIVVGTGTLAANRSYLLVRDGGVWSEVAVLQSTQGGATGEYGYAVGLSGDRVMVGDRAGNGGTGDAVPFGVGAACLCVGDIDGCGSVGISDLLALLSAWGPNPGHPADLDGDDVVGITDLLILLASWGPCP